MLSAVAISHIGALGQSAADHSTAETRARERIAGLYEQESAVHEISHVSLSPDGLSVAWSVVDPKNGKHRIFLASLKQSQTVRAVTAQEGREDCDQDTPEWAPDRHSLAFLSDCATPGQFQVFTLDTLAPQRPAKQLTHVAGYVSQLNWSPDGAELAFLYVEKASRTPSPMAAENRTVGVIDDLVTTEIERVAVAESSGSGVRLVTPSSLYVFEYNWSPNGASLAYTAAPPPGDDNWYIAQLYTQAVDRPEPVSIYKPKLQIALPRWSPAGKSIAFIEGLMSDEGATGGEIFEISREGGAPRNLTPGRPSTPSWFTWTSSDELLLTEFVGGSIAITSLDTSSGKSKTLWQGGETIHASSVATSLTVTGPGVPLKAAFVRTSWSRLPEVWAGPVAHPAQITRINEAMQIPLPASQSIDWTNEHFPVQGWLLFPSNYDPSKKYPVIVSVHGGPAWISTPTWKDDDFNVSLFTTLGYFVLVPNVRGSYGQGEKFTLANRREWGFGDLEDMVAGVDAVVKRYPVDSDRVGVIGWSYGASTAMMAVARTDRFRAAVAGAGAVDMLSYYGENSIDKWMIPYFGASVYDDPAAYARCSAITYVKNAKTPTLMLVGERDGEAPPSQSLEFWHALKEFHVPTQLVIYADEGHGFSKQDDRIDLTLRAFEWFEHYTAAK